MVSRKQRQRDKKEVEKEEKEDPSRFLPPMP